MNKKELKEIEEFKEMLNKYGKYISDDRTILLFYLHTREKTVKDIIKLINTNAKEFNEKEILKLKGLEDQLIRYNKLVLDQSQVMKIKIIQAKMRIN